MAYVEKSLYGGQFSLAQELTTTAASTNLFDITGAGPGVAPAMIGSGGLNTAIGVDIGAGDGVATPEVLVSIDVTGTGAGTVTIVLEAAPDNGSYSPGTYYTVYSSGAFVGTTLNAGDTLKFPVPPIPQDAALPRFYRINYVIAGSFTATLTANLLLNAPDLRQPTLYGNNFVAV
ncbi:MAG: Bbp16 family capsid cement protein [Sterolibacterium sp.]